RRSALDPFLDEALLFVGQARVVGELAVGGIGVPGRPAIGAADFPNRVRPGSRILIIGQGEGSRLIGPVTGLTKLFGHRCYLFTVCDLSLVLEFPNSAYQTAGRYRYGAADGLSGQQFIDGDCQVTPAHVGPACSDGVLIVNAPTVANDAILVEQEDLRRTLS